MKWIIRVFYIIAIILFISFGAEVALVTVYAPGEAGSRKDDAALHNTFNTSSSERERTSINDRSVNVNAELDYSNNDRGSAEEQNAWEDSPVPSRKEYFLTFDEIMALDNLGLRDKITAMAILKKLKKQDAVSLLEIANGGITMEEFEAVHRLIETALGRKDLEKLMGIIARNKILYAEGMAGLR